MEEPWSQICMKWVQLLKLTSSSNLISLTDGKFFLTFMQHYLNLDQECNTAYETFDAVDSMLRNEFSSADLVNLSDAQQGNEEELVKTITLFMYLAVVKYEHLGPKTYLDDEQFSEEAKFRMKYILKALLEQHGVLTPSLLTEIIGNKFNCIAGHLSAGNPNKLRSLSRASLGSPVVFTSSPGQESPLKEFLDSPTVRQVTKYQRQVKEKEGQIRELRTQLEMEKMFAMEEVEHLKKAKEAADTEVLALKQEIRKKSAASDIDFTCDDSNTELKRKFHSLLKEKKDGDKYLAMIEKQLEERVGEKEEMQARIDALAGKLNTANEEKRKANLALVKMEDNLESLNAENGKLEEIIQALSKELDDLNEQSLNKSLPKKTTGNVASFHVETMDMGNVSLDADESCFMPAMDVNSVAGENMMDAMERRLEEEIDFENEARTRDKENANQRMEELKVEVKEKENEVDASKEHIQQLEDKLELERGENKMLKENIELINKEKEGLRAMQDKTKMDFDKYLYPYMQDNTSLRKKLRNSQEKVDTMEKDASVLKAQLDKEKQIKEGLKESLIIQTQNLDQKQNEVQTLTQNLSSMSIKLQEAENKEDNINASLDSQSRRSEKLSDQYKRISEEKHALEEDLIRLNEENSELKIKLEKLNDELSNSDQNNQGNLKYLQSELEIKKRELHWEQMKSANLEKSMTNQDIKAALKDQKERYQKQHKELLTQVMEKNKQNLIELKNMYIQETESLEQEIKKLNKDKKLILVKYEDSKQKVTNMKENFEQRECVTQQKLIDATDKIRKLKEENDKINVQLGVTKENNRDLTLLLETSKSRKICDCDRQSSKGTTDTSSNLSNKKASLPDFKEDDNVFQKASASAGPTASDGQASSALKAKPPSGSGSLFHCDEELGEVFSSSNLMNVRSSNSMEVPPVDKFVSNFLFPGAKLDCCELDGEGRISELSRRNSMCLPHLKSSYPVESQFLQEKLGTEDEIRQSNIKPQQPVNSLATKDIPSQDTCEASISCQSTSKHPGRAKRQFSEEYENTPRLGMMRSHGQLTDKAASNTTSEPPLQHKPKMPDLLSPCLPNKAKRKSEEYVQENSLQDSDYWSKRRKKSWCKTKEKEGEPLLHNS